jgi:hypothetical protein
MPELMDEIAIRRYERGAGQVVVHFPELGFEVPPAVSIPWFGGTGRELR